MLCERNDSSQRRTETPVLILVLMEDALRVVAKFNDETSPTMS